MRSERKRMTISKKQIASFLLTFLIPFYLIRFRLGAPTTILELSAIILFISVLFLKSKKIILALKSTNRLVLIGTLLIIIGGVIGVLISPDKTVALGELKGFIIIPIIAGVTILALGPKNEKFVKMGLYLSSVLISIEAIIEWLFNIKTYDGRVLGIYRIDANASPNYLALFVTPIAVMLLHDLFNMKNNNNYRILRLSAFIAMAVAICMTKSRAAIAVLIVFLLYELYCYLSDRFNKNLINSLSLIIMIVTILISAKVALPNLSANDQDGRVSSSNNIRYEIWSVTTKEIIPQNWLLGVGLGNFQNTFKSTTLHRVNFDEYISPLAVTPHDVFLSTWVDLGLIGLIGFLLVLSGTINSKRQNKLWLIALISILLLGLFDTTVYKNDLGFFFWIAIFAGTFWDGHPLKGKNE